MIHGKIVVDACTGTGVVGVFVGLKMNPYKIILTDIDWKASCNAYVNVVEKKLGVKAIVLTCNLLDCIRDRSIDVLIANPPYLPTINDEVLYPDVEAGLLGLDVISDLIKQASFKLKRHGVLYLVFSSLTGTGKVLSLLEKNGFVLKRIVTEHYFFEDIVAVEAVLNE